MNAHTEHLKEKSQCSHITLFPTVLIFFPYLCVHSFPLPVKGVFLILTSAFGFWILLPHYILGKFYFGTIMGESRKMREEKPFCYTVTAGWDTPQNFALRWIIIVKKKKKKGISKYIFFFMPKYFKRSPQTCLLAIHSIVQL